MKLLNEDYINVLHPQDTPKKSSLSVQVEEEEMKEGNKPAEKKENHCPQCGKEFKGERGVLSHQRHPKSKCHVV